MVESKKARAARAKRAAKEKAKGVSRIITHPNAPDKPASRKKKDGKKLTATVIDDNDDVPYFVPENNPEPTPEKKRKSDRPLVLGQFLTPKQESDLINSLTSGNYVETACAYAGIGRTAHYDRVKKGTRAEALCEKELREPTENERGFILYANTVKKAQAEAEVAGLSIIMLAASKGNWQAAAWRLERMFPDRFGRSRLELTGAGGKPLPTGAPNALVINMVRRNGGGEMVSEELYKSNPGKISREKDETDK